MPQPATVYTFSICLEKNDFESIYVHSYRGHSAVEKEVNMKFFDALCETVTRALGLASLSPWKNEPGLQHPLGPSETLEALFPIHTAPPRALETISRAKASKSQLEPGPIFSPPNSSPNFACDYSAMRGWKHTAGVGARNQWLEKPISEEDPTGGIYNVFTNYDLYAPVGITRKYHLNVTDQMINADGVAREEGGKVFNGQYPGPWLEACWGDTLEITVENHLKYNGTTIHWHGVRLLNEFEYDGVNGITQCPIARGDKFTYKFNVTQYGTSWYHSHYSLQYADGLAGPITFHGPSSADYDVALEPFLFGDWSHNSAFQDYAAELRQPPAKMQTVILNGKGFYNCTLSPKPGCNANKAPPIFEQVFQRGRKYLMRLINTSTASTFIFSIDKHMLQVVAMDFVAIEPYVSSHISKKHKASTDHFLSKYTDSILVGIGQRYHVVVEARPSNDLIPVEDQNYWIRIVGAHGCFDVEEGQQNELLGIIRYNSGSQKRPTTTSYQFSKQCADEPYASLVPVVPMTVTAKDHPANNIDPDHGDNFEVGFESPSANYTVPHGNFTRWDILDTPMWLEFGDPTINHVKNYTWNPSEYAIITEDYTRDDWVYLIITANGTTNQHAAGKRRFIALAHPIHLHGHDFVLLAQQNRPFHVDDLSNGTFKYDNPPRRDVALLPGDGYLAIGFRTDNPGIWIMHCHIAWHASSGLALQIRENNHQINLSPDFVKEKERVCGNWHNWYSNHSNWFNSHEFQEDSGI
ncbi:MAG: hypothetical protein Q9217_004171 [Psora testacea]